jgi:AraC family transcriptional regulator
MNWPVPLYTASVDAEITSDHAVVRMARYIWPDETIFRQDNVHTIAWSRQTPVVKSRISLTLEDGTSIHGDVGRIHLVPAGSRIKSIGGAASAPFASCSIDRTYANEMLPELDGLLKASAIDAFDLRGPRIERLLTHLMNEARQPGYAHEMIIDYTSSLLLVEIMRVIGNRPNDPLPQKGGLAPWQIARIRERVDTLDAGLATISELAALCGISEAHLRRGFKQSSGQTIHDYVISVVAGRSAAMLADTDETIEIIARRVGFSGPNGFAMAFSRRFGISPGKYRTRIRAKPPTWRNHQ